MGRLVTAKPILDKAPPPKRKPDRHKANPDKVMAAAVAKSRKSRKSAAPKEKAAPKARRSAREPSEAGRKSMADAKAAGQRKAAVEEWYKAERFGEQDPESEEEEPNEPTDKARFFIRKAWGKNPSKLIPGKFYPRFQSKGKVHRYCNQDRVWPLNILNMLNALATASKQLGGGEDVGKQCINKVLEVMKARLEDGGEALVGTVEGGLIFDDVARGAGRWSAETGVKIP